MADRQQSADREVVIKNKRHLTLSPPTSSLEFIAVDIPGPLPRTKNGGGYVLIITDHYSKSAREMSP